MIDTDSTSSDSPAGVTLTDGYFYKATNWLKGMLHLCGVDRPVAYVILGRGWSVLAGPITLYMIASFLTRDEQGYYYTFGSILGLQIFFELGLSYVILQVCQP